MFLFSRPSRRHVGVSAEGIRHLRPVGYENLGGVAVQGYAAWRKAPALREKWYE